MIYFILAILLLLVVVSIYYSYKKSADKKRLLISIVFVLSVLFFTYISKVIIVHKPIFVLHLALVMLSWAGLFFYLVKNRLHLWMILAPLASTVVFFAMALFFRENA
jgi:hypothetical protein